jgi:TRAP-type mannitol/chloroaromatic compound transport system substrate-binding protein
MVAKDPVFRKVYESQEAFKEQIKKYHKISEQSYFKAREIKN